MPLSRLPAGKRIAGVLLAGTAIGCAVGLVPRALGLRLIDSHGFFEDVCLAGYLSAMAILTHIAWRCRKGAALEGALALLLMVAAELDLTGVLAKVEDRPLTLLDPRVSPGERAIAVGFLVLAAGLAVRFLTVRRHAFLAALRGREPAAWLISAGILLVGAGVALAEVQGFFPWQAGYRGYKGTLFALSVAEEMAELCVPYCFLLAAWELRKPWLGGDRVRPRVEA